MNISLSFLTLKTILLGTFPLLSNVNKRTTTLTILFSPSHRPTPSDHYQLDISIFQEHQLHFAYPPMVSVYTIQFHFHEQSPPSYPIADVIHEHQRTLLLKLQCINSLIPLSPDLNLTILEGCSMVISLPPSFQYIFLHEVHFLYTMSNGYCRGFSLVFRPCS